MNQTDVERLLDDFVAAGVFEQSADGTLGLTDAVRERREQTRRTISELGDDEYVATLDEYVAAGEDAPDAVDRAVLADASAMHEVAPDLDRERCLAAALALSRLETTRRESPLPAGFVEVQGDEIAGFIERNRGAVLYFWREDCDPCDALEGHFETLLENGEIPEEIALGAVYGPDAAEVARNDYDVAVSPTVLFCANGRVQARQIGNRGPEALRAELDLLEQDLA